MAAALALVLPSKLGAIAGALAAIIVVGVPLLRILWLIVRWWQEHDLRFVMMGVGVLLLIGIGASVSLLAGSS